MGALRRSRERPGDGRPGSSPAPPRDAEVFAQKQFWRIFVGFCWARPAVHRPSTGKNRWTTGGQLPHSLGMNCGHLEAFGARPNDNLLTDLSSSTARPLETLFCPPFVHRSACALSSQKPGFPQNPQALLQTPNSYLEREMIRPHLTLDRQALLVNDRDPKSSDRPTDRVPGPWRTRVLSGPHIHHRRTALEGYE